MSLRIGVLGEPKMGGLPTHGLLAGIETNGNPPLGEEIRDRDGRIWRLFEPGPTEDMLDFLDQCHALVVFPPQDVAYESAGDLLFRDLLALRKHRGRNALPAGLPVLVVRDPSLVIPDVYPQAKLKSKIREDLSRGYGGISLFVEAPEKNQGNSMEAFAGISRRAIRLAAGYQRQSWWAGIRLWLAVFLLAVFALSLVGSAVFLALNPEIEWVLQYRQLKHGLSGSNPFLLKAESLEALEERRGAIDGFLEQNPGITQVRLDSLKECRERLNLFIRKIRESQNWPKPVDIHDLPTLRQVVGSLENWNPGVPANAQYPLVEAAISKKEELELALSGSESFLSILEAKRNQGDGLLKSNPEALADLKVWFTEVEKFSSELDQLRQKNKSMVLDEIGEAWDGCAAVKGKVQDMARLVAGLGVLPPSPGSRAALFPSGADFEKEVRETFLETVDWTSIWRRGEKGFGGDPRFMGRIRERARMAYEEWFQLGSSRLGAELKQLATNRSLLEKWILKKSREPVWSKWGELVWKMEAIAHADLSEMESFQSRNPWTASAAYLQKSDFRISPGSVEIQGPSGFFGKNPSDWNLVLRTGGAGEELALEGTTIEKKVNVDILRVENPMGKSLLWDWSHPLQLSFQNKIRSAERLELSAVSPLEMGPLFGKGDLKISWSPDGAIPKVPRLLIR